MRVLLLSIVFFAAPALGAPASGPSVDQAIAQRAGGLARCLVRHQKRGPVPETGMLRFALRPDGTPMEVRVDVAHSPLARCLYTQVRGWRFPAFHGRPLMVELPLRFVTREG